MRQNIGQWGTVKDSGNIAKKSLENQCFSRLMLVFRYFQNVSLVKKHLGLVVRHELPSVARSARTYNRFFPKKTKNRYKLCR